MIDLARLPTARPALSPAARALRLQRIFARVQEGASYKDIAAEEGLSRERLRQIVRAATARGKEPPDHKRMQFARLEPALRLAARGVADGDVKAVPLLLKLVDRLDRYCDPGDSTTRPCSATWRCGRGGGAAAAARNRGRRPGRLVRWAEAMNSPDNQPLPCPRTRASRLTAPRYPATLDPGFRGDDAIPW
jgi:hypothetical protein